MKLTTIIGICMVVTIVCRVVSFTFMVIGAEHRIIRKLIEQSPYLNEKHSWNQSMLNGDVVYGRPIGFNTRRINLTNFRKIAQYLKPDSSNLYEATVKAIEACKPEQYSVRKHCKEASVSYAKYQIAQGVLDESVLEKLRTIKIKRHREPFRPTRTEADVSKLLEVNQQLRTSAASKDLNEILILTAFYTGLRVSELVNLKMEDLCE